MNFDKFYENIVLRDLIEYLIPGTIFLLSISILISSLPGTNVIELYIISSFKESSLYGFFVILFSYTAGHCLTAISQHLFRSKEESILVFNEIFKDDWTRENITNAVAKLYKIDNNEAGKVLADRDKFDFLRETLRSYTQIRMPLAFREFIIRLSILSRFCQNMSHGLGCLLFSLIYAVYMSEYRVINRIDFKELVSIIVSVTLFLLLGYAIKVFWRRANSLRKQMIKNTFQIWLTDYMELIPREPKENKAT